MRGLLSALVGAMLLCANEAQAAKLIAVLPLDVSNTKGKLDKAGQASLEEMLRDTATNTLRPLGWTILSGENTIQVLIDNGVKPEECGSQSCHLANARELKAEAFISGTVQYVDDSFVASIRLIETKSGSLLTSERVRGRTVSAVSEAFEAKATSFFERAGLLQASAPPSSRDTTTAPPVAEALRPQVKKGQVTEAVGSLTVMAKPKEAVRLELVDPNGRKLVSGAPYENKAAVPGQWKVVARASGYEDEAQTVEVLPDDAMLVKFDLKLPGSLSVTGEPAGAAVEVTGPSGFKDVGGLPWEAAGLKRGTYQVKVSRNGYADQNESVEVPPGKTATVKVALQKIDLVKQNAFVDANVKHWLDQGNSHLQQREYAPAIAAYQKVIEVRPNSADAHYGLGLVYLNTSRHALATTSLRKALELSPQNEDAMFSLARAHDEMLKIDEAVKLYRMYLSQFPKGVFADMARLRLRVLDSP